MAFGLPYEEHCNAIEEYRSRNAIRAARRSPRQRFRVLRRGHFVLALGVGQLPERAGFEHQRAAAVGALLVEGLIGLLLLAADRLGGLAVGVSGAGVERSEPA